MLLGVSDVLLVLTVWCHQKKGLEMSQNARPSVVKVFSATKARDREMLGDRVTEWLASNPTLDILDKHVLLSSDTEFHCLTIVLFCKEVL